MKPKKNPLLLPAITFAFCAASSALHAQQWNIVGNTSPTPGYTLYDWNVATNWTPNIIPNGIDASALFDINILLNAPDGPQLQGYHVARLNEPITVGNLTLGDSVTSPTGFNGNGFYEIASGTGGTLTFQASSGNASLQKTAGSGTTADLISAPVILNSTLAADLRTGGIGITGPISGSGGLIRSGSVSGAVSAALPNGGAFLRLTNNNNSYTGATSIQHGTLLPVLNGNVLASANSVLGNSATPIVIGTPGFATTTASHNSQILRFSAGSDNANYTVTRGVDFSGVTQTGAGSVQLVLQGNDTDGENTNRLTLNAPIVVGGSRGPNIIALRSGLTIDITQNITGTLTGGSISFNGYPPAPNADGRGAGTIRLSDLPRSYDTVQHLNSGTLIIAGSVGALNTDSPIGWRIVGLSNGGGIGNIVGSGNFNGGSASNDTSPDSVRSLYLEKAGTSYARNLTPGGGSTSTPAAGGYGPVSVINGFKIGGLNTTGTTTFSGAIVPGNPAVGASTSNPITTAVNLALIAQTGGTVAFTGNISDGTSATDATTRITINQFRNNPHIDGTNNAGSTVVPDGNPDNLANNLANYTADRLVGTPTGGTVILSGNNIYDGGTEVLGGTLTVNNTDGSGTGNGDVKVVSGAKLGGNGTIFGNAVLDNGAGLAFTVNTPVDGHDSFEFVSDLTLGMNNAVTILDGIGAEIGIYTLASIGATFSGTPLVTPIMPLGMQGTISVVGNELRLNITQIISADYVAWIGGYPSVTGLDRAESADPDGDGVTNREEYAFGLNPESGASSNPIVVQLNKATGKFTYTRRLPSLSDPDMVYIVKTSTNLTDWTEDEGAAEQVLSTSVDNIQTVEVTLSPALLANPALFVRVEGQ